MVNFTRGCKIDVYVSVAMVTLHHLACCRSWKLHYWPNCRVTLTLSLTCVKLCVLRSFKHPADARFKGTCVYEKCGTHVPLTLQIKNALLKEPPIRYTWYVVVDFHICISVFEWCKKKVQFCDEEVPRGDWYHNVWYLCLYTNMQIKADQRRGDFKIPKLMISKLCLKTLIL